MQNHGTHGRKPWFDNDCKQARKARKKAERYFRRHSMVRNLNTYKILNAKARRTFKQHKRQSWRNFVSRINSRTPISKVWNMIQKIKGKGSKFSIHHLKDGDQLLTNTSDIANKLAETFAKHSSSSNYDPQFKRYQTQQEKKSITFSSDNGEDYNELFSIYELHTAPKTSS